MLLGGKPGNFDLVHPRLEQLTEAVKQWDLKELPREECAAKALLKLQDIFANFETFRKAEEKEEKEQ